MNYPPTANGGILCQPVGFCMGIKHIHRLEGFNGDYCSSGAFPFMWEVCKELLVFGSR